MLEACRTCLRLIDLENLPFYEIEDDDVQLSSESTRLKLLSFIPEMALDITPKSMLCAKCHKRLEAVIEFKTECLQTEKIIMHYLKTKLNLYIKNLDLKDVSAFNAADIKIIGNETVEVSAVKEDMEVYDSVITNLKEEVDDFLLENSNIVQSMTDVPCSLTDTRISEEEAVEASVEDEAVKDEIEVCDTVITNLKDDADDFLPRPSTDVWIGKEEAVGASVEDDTVKNEMEVCDIVITNLKDKAQDFLSESVEVAQLTMAMAGSSTDIRVSKDKADTLDEEMEVCDSVITNLTDKAGDFSTKSVKVARPKNMVPRTHTGEKPYRCETCKCSFTKKTNLTRHLRIHTGKRLYICTFCDKGFNQNHSLTEHMRIHTGKIPYHCEMCNCSFTNKRNLTRHLRIHTGERPYICTFCDKGFYQNYSLTEHMRIHTGERPYHCEICDGRFQRNTHLKKHLRTHTGEQSYVCTTCGQAYTSKFILNKHKCTSNIEKLHK